MVDTLPTCNLTAPASQFSCRNPYPDCINSLGFQFSSLWKITNYVAACPSDHRLFSATDPSLTQRACEVFVGTDSWTRYPTADIYSRLTTWKFPLLQLVAVFPKPPLSFGNGIFVLTTLLGNPVGTLKSLLLKFASAQMRADYWIQRFNGELAALIQAKGDDRKKEVERRWKALALIVVSYDEWGHKKGNEVQAFLTTMLTSSMPFHKKIDFLDVCERRANALARDRATESLPMIAAQTIFIGSIAIAFGRTPAAAATDGPSPNPSTYINIEAHSIAFTALYFWLIPAGIFGAIIGVSSTETAIPEIIHDLETDISLHFDPWLQKPLAWHLFTDDNESPGTALRQRRGGFYSWQPDDVRQRWIRDVKDAAAVTSARNQTQTPPNPSPSVLTRLRHALTLSPGSWLFSLILVLLPLLTGLLISALIPPNTFWCRDWLELSIGASWILNGILDSLPYKLFSWTSDFEYKRMYAFAFTKDALSAIFTLLLVIMTQVGILNKCSCYSVSGTTGLAFPEEATIAGALAHDIVFTYPAIAFLCIGFELLVFPYFVYRQYRAAFRVFLQRDDRESNLRHWHQFKQSRFVAFFRAAGRWLGGLLRMPFGNRKMRQQRRGKKNPPATTTEDPVPGDIERTGTSSARATAGGGYLLIPGQGEGGSNDASNDTSNNASNDASENEIEMEEIDLTTTAATAAAPAAAASADHHGGLKPRVGHARQPSTSSAEPMLPEAGGSQG